MKFIKEETVYSLTLNRSEVHVIVDALKSLSNLGDGLNAEEQTLLVDFLGILIRSEED